MTVVKIDGISRIEDARAVAEARTDYLGMIFASSPRQVTPETARRIVGALDGFQIRPQVVGVFVNTPASEINRLAGFCGLELVQLSGDESWEYCRDINRPVIKVIHVSENSGAGGVLEEIATGERVLGRDGFTCLLDTSVEGSYGGTGKKFDWELAREVSQQRPVMIAGGLTPENVEEVIRVARPWGVDVSSGVETGGSKDIAKIKAFVQAVRRVDDEIQHIA
ncbi:MAG TPA: phosphoribosylanthranilate isomerase [Dehalococcoidia bacterium]|nr:phosphoribosylanthranilate isomerase [Dehalococcoidia bacterium]